MTAAERHVAAILAAHLTTLDPRFTWTASRERATKAVK